MMHRFSRASLSPPVTQERMVLSSNSISLPTREPAAAAWDASWGKGSKSSDQEGSRAGDEETREPPKDDAEEDHRKKLQERLALEEERKLREQQCQQEQEQRRRETAQEQARPAERERETSVKIYQYRRFVLPPEHTAMCSHGSASLRPFPHLQRLLVGPYHPFATQALHCRAGAIALQLFRRLPVRLEYRPGPRGDLGGTHTSWIWTPWSTWLPAAPPLPPSVPATRVSFFLLENVQCILPLNAGSF